MRVSPGQLLATGTALSLLTLTHFATPAAAANDLYVTVESPGVQQSSLYTNPAAFGATNVIQDDFNSLKSGYYANGIPFDKNLAIGIYSQGGIQGANQYGGANGKGNYFTVAAPFSNTSSTLSFAQPQRYFGFWLSALDKNNRLSFYSNSTLVSSFSAQDVLNFVKRQPDAQNYFGNPNSRFLNQDKSEPFAYLNFFAAPNNPTSTFNQVVFSNNNSRGTGFEADNFTIATSYTNTSGKPIASVPFAPSSTWGIVILMLGYTARSLNIKRQQIFNLFAKYRTEIGEHEKTHQQTVKGN